MLSQIFYYIDKIVEWLLEQWKSLTQRREGSRSHQCLSWTDLDGSKPLSLCLFLSGRVNKMRVGFVVTRDYSSRDLSWCRVIEWFFLVCVPQLYSVCVVCAEWRTVILRHHTNPRGMVNWGNCRPPLWYQDHWELAKVVCVCVQTKILLIYWVCYRNCTWLTFICYIR